MIFLAWQLHLVETFDDTFNEAMHQLVQWGSVIFGEDMT